MTGARVAIVDDNATNLRLASYVLDKVGYDVRTAANGDELMAILEHFTPRLVLMDLQLPGVDGFELTRRLRADARFTETQIVALTAFAMPGDRERALEAGCHGFVTKPVSPDRLREVVAAHLGAAPP